MYSLERYRENGDMRLRAIPSATRMAPRMDLRGVAPQALGWLRQNSHPWWLGGSLRGRVSYLFFEI